MYLRGEFESRHLLRRQERTAKKRRPLDRPLYSLSRVPTHSWFWNEGELIYFDTRALDCINSSIPHIRKPRMCGASGQGRSTFWRRKPTSNPLGIKPGKSALRVARSYC